MTQPISKYICNTTWQVQVRNRLDDWSHETCELELEKYVFYYLFMETIYALYIRMQFRFLRLYLVRITPLRRYNAKILKFTGAFIFQFLWL
jgi:hypothetical protein